MDYYTGSSPYWEFFIQDKEGVNHPIATQVGTSDAFYFPKVGMEQVYTTPNDTNPDISAAFFHPMAWQGGGPMWVDTPTAYSTFTYSSPDNSANCPYFNAFNQLHDQRVWIVGAPVVSSLGPVCSLNPFWPR
jgi:hypothetical protein